MMLRHVIGDLLAIGLVSFVSGLANDGIKKGSTTGCMHEMRTATKVKGLATPIAPTPSLFVKNQ